MSSNNKVFDPNAKGFDPTVDRYPDVRKAVATVMHEEVIDQGDIERIEITLLGNGEVTWRVWPAKAEEPEGGVFRQHE